MSMNGDPAAYMGEGVPVVFPVIGWAFAGGTDGSITLVLSLPGLPVQMHIPFDRLSFARFVTAAEHARAGVAQ